jgi:tRNA/tmRNA/rRNA uracil-C5-methylase (TrmA/RlmC/RlmD family)
MVVFVPLTMPGDEVRARVISRKKRYAHARLLEILKPSPEREEPRCAAFGKCGGCEWQHIPYPKQWETKLRGLREALRRITLELEVPLDEFPAASLWEYRNRVQLRGRGRELGFYATASRDLVPIESCPIARSEVNACLTEIRRKGERVAGAYKVEIEVLPEGKVRTLWNMPHGAGGFRQVNDEQNQHLQDWVDSQIGEGAVLLDLYGGAGNLSLAPSRRFQEVHCVDTSAPLGGKHEPPQVFHRFEVASWLRGYQGREGTYSALLDPPRSGMGNRGEEIVAALGDLGVGEVVLVGCDQDAWARDMGVFLRRGWDLTRVAALDFFPHTHHLEAVARLAR